MASHLTFREWEILYRLNKQGTSKAEIAKVLGRDRSTIYRELARNTGGRGYRPKQDQRLAEQRRETSRRSCKLENPDVHAYVEEKLKASWSPDQIAGRIKRDAARRKTYRVSRPTIYNWIHTRATEWKAYRSWQRGANENTNGLPRQFFPKGPISRGSVTTKWPASKTYSTNVPDDASAIEPPRKSSPKRLCCD